MVVAPGGTHIYGLAHGGGVAIYARDAAGRPVPAGVAVVPSARDLAPAPDGRDLYVIAQDGEEDGALTHFSVGAGGALTYVGCYGLPAGAGRPGSTSSSGPRTSRSARMGGTSTSSAPAWAVPARGGRPAHLRRQRQGRLGDVRALALSPDGRNVYVASGGETPFPESRIVHFRRDPATGALTYAGCLGADFRDGTGCPALPPGVVSTAGAKRSWSARTAGTCTRPAGSGV